VTTSLGHGPRPNRLCHPERDRHYHAETVFFNSTPAAAESQKTFADPPCCTSEVLPVLLRPRGWKIPPRTYRSSLALHRRGLLSFPCGLGPSSHARGWRTTPLYFFFDTVLPFSPWIAPASLFPFPLIRGLRTRQTTKANLSCSATVSHWQSHLNSGRPSPRSGLAFQQSGLVSPRFLS